VAVGGSVAGSGGGWSMAAGRARCSLRVSGRCRTAGGLLPEGRMTSTIWTGRLRLAALARSLPAVVCPNMPICLPISSKALTAALTSRRPWLSICDIARSAAVRRSRSTRSADSPQISARCAKAVSIACATDGVRRRAPPATTPLAGVFARPARMAAWVAFRSMTYSATNRCSVLERGRSGRRSEARSLDMMQVNTRRPARVSKSGAAG
jgi:hypothetical protein